MSDLEYKLHYRTVDNITTLVFDSKTQICIESGDAERICGSYCPFFKIRKTETSIHLEICCRYNIVKHTFELDGD